MPAEHLDLAVAHTVARSESIGRPRSPNVSSNAGRCARRDPSGSRTAGTSAGPRRRTTTPLRDHRPDLRARRVEPRDVTFALLERGRRFVFVDRVLAQLDQHQVALGVESDPDEPGAEQRLVLLDRSAVVDGQQLGRRPRGARRRCDRGTARPRRRAARPAPSRRAPTASRRPCGPGSRRCARPACRTRRRRWRRRGRTRCDRSRRSSPLGSGSRSSRPPVSLHFTSMHAVRVEVEAPWPTPGDTCTRWNRSRCMPV